MNPRTLESGVRGYVITKRPSFLTPFYRARREWPLAAHRLAQLVGDDRVQAPRLARVDTLTQRYITEYALPVIDIAKVSQDAATSPDSTLEGKGRLDAIRGALAQMVSTERVRSQRRAEAARATARRAELAGFGGLTLSVLVVLAFGAWVTRSSL